METQSAAVNQDGETITDIQNYLASFNKEIQDNGEQEVAAAGSTTASQAQQPASTQDAGDTTYYVAQGGSISGYQSFEQSQGQFDGNTYYTQQYYTSENQQDFTTIPAYTGTATTTGNTASGEIATAVTNAGVQQVAVSLAGGEGQDGLQQIVLAAASENQEGTDGEATEISVTIPASLASQAATEELLQAVEAQSTEPEQPTFVAMQPTAGQSQIRMVVQNSEGMEQQEEVSGSTAGATIVTSDGQEITVSDEGTLQMMANLAEQAAQNSTDGNNQVILNAGNSYQTVTIVPSDTNPGEVSYVLIVSQPEDVKDSAQKSGVNLDMSIYDFNEGEQHTAAADGDDISTGKTRIVKISPKKSQAVSQAHMCNYCNYTSPKRYLLSRHMKSHSEERPHKCSVCERGFKTLASLQNHVNTHTGTRPHQCKECDSAFTTSGELVRHVRYKHTHEKPHKCTECDYASVELSKLKRHMRCHTGERPYQCPHCTYASPDTYKLKRHLRIHTGEKPYECDVCHARFTQSNSLKAHKLIHSGNKPIFQCELCPTTCGRKTDLRIHVQKLHTSDKPLKCKRCGKSFPDRYTYKVHVKTHEGEKCFKCDLCPYASISQRHLESHMLIHTDQKPYQCEQCDQAFRQKQLLKRHKNLYHDPYYVPPTPKEKTHECPECGRAFRHKGNLIRHMAIHDPEASAQEKAAALRLGRKKLIDTNGEEYTDEDEESEEELDEDDPTDEIHHQLANQESITLQANQVTTAEGQQVVVLEVIQLQGPEGEQQAVAVVAGGGMDMGPTIQTAVTPEDSSHKAVRRNIKRVEQNDVASASQGEILIDDSLKAPQVNTAMVKRGRGRPRRNPLPEPMETGDGEVTDKDNIDGEVEENEQMSAETDIDGHGRIKKRRIEEEVFQNQTASTPIKRGRGRPPNSSKARRFRLATEILDGQNLPDEAEIARREAEAAKRRLEQKQKDMAECFGFKDDDDEEEESEPVAVHTVTSDAETAMQLLAAMQQVEGELQQ